MNENIPDCSCSWHEFEPGENERDCEEEATKAHGALLDQYAPIGLSMCARDGYRDRIAKMKQWSMGIGTTRANITLEELKNRTKGDAQYIRRMDKFEADETHKACGVSHIICDRDGQLLVACFGKRLLVRKDQSLGMKRTRDEMSDYEDEGLNRQGRVSSQKGLWARSASSSGQASPVRPSPVSSASSLLNREKRSQKREHKRHVREINAMAEFFTAEERAVFMERKEADNLVVWDGLEQQVLDTLDWETQHLVHTNGLGKKKDKKRHDRTDNSRLPEGVYAGENNDKMVFSSRILPQCRESCGTNLHRIREERVAGKPLVIQNGKEIKFYDSVGALHLDRCWVEQGHQKLVVSSDLLGKTVTRTQVSMRYMDMVNRHLQSVLAPYVSVCAGDEYPLLRKSFRAAALNESEENGPGFHTGHVIVYNEPVHQHIDAADSGLCITFCTGKFSGGLMYFSDLDKAFFYEPGTVMIFRSSLLFHGVTRWKPEGGISHEGIFPGRRSHVLFTKAVAFESLHVQRPGWFRKTSDGVTPEPHPKSNMDETDDDPLKDGDRSALANLSRLWKTDAHWKNDAAWNLVAEIKLC